MKNEVSLKFIAQHQGSGGARAFGSAGDAAGYGLNNSGYESPKSGKK